LAHEALARRHTLILRENISEFRLEWVRNGEN
jgi:hypothetical protein